MLQSCICMTFRIVVGQLSNLDPSLVYTYRTWFMHPSNRPAGGEPSSQAFRASRMLVIEMPCFVLCSDIVEERHRWLSYIAITNCNRGSPHWTSTRCGRSYTVGRPAISGCQGWFNNSYHRLLQSQPYSNYNIMIQAGSLQKTLNAAPPQSFIYYYCADCAEGGTNFVLGKVPNA